MLEKGWQTDSQLLLSGEFSAESLLQQLKDTNYELSESQHKANFLKQGHGITSHSGRADTSTTLEISIAYVLAFCYVLKSPYGGSFLVPIFLFLPATTGKAGNGKYRRP